MVDIKTKNLGQQLTDDIIFALLSPLPTEIIFSYERQEYA